MMDAATARARLQYDPESGCFTWRDADRSMFGSDKAWKVFQTAYAGKPAGSVCDKGYLVIRLGGQIHKAHRLAWLIAHGEWPNGWLDHVNRDRLDNRIANLREASPTINARNVSMRRDNRSGVRGVVWHKATQKWRAQIAVGGVTRHIGVFDSIDAAAAARRVAEARLHGGAHG